MLGFHIQFLLHTYYFNGFLHSHGHLFLLHFLFGLHFPVSHVLLESYEICFTNIFDSLNPVIMLSSFILIYLEYIIYLMDHQEYNSLYDI